ncbi:non-ribosomal peptide synthetase [Flavobacterium poyangense]|uniref:non-ribosomal peptide synthetase n=1 Tax=Flavobacterium poyangense TaxID=2204302 RepID=UPI001421D29C|nr:non-ribosomal peptide synthetase [Flavobacterium sp. JXAS1]
MQTLLKKLNSLNIKLSLYGEKLDINAPKGVMTSELLEEIKLNKQNIIDFIKRSQNVSSSHISIPVLEQQETYTISSAQRRLWLLCQQESQNAAYNIFRVLEFKGSLNTEALQNAFIASLERHESLRTVFVETPDAEIRQRIVGIKYLGFQIQQLDLSANYSDKKLRTIVEKETKRPFDLAKDCLVRVTLIKTAADSYVFVLVIHHIVSDGWSMELMVNELFVFYNTFLNGGANPLQPLPIQYKDYALWQQNQIREEQNSEHKSYWLNHFEGYTSCLDLPVNTTKFENETVEVNSINKRIDTEVLKKFSALCKSQESTLFMGLVSVLNVLFYKYTNQSDIVIGSPIAGRVHADLQNQIGFYVNTLALRTQFEEKDSFIDLLSKVRAVTLGAFEHQIYPFDELVENLNIKREANRNPLFDTLLTLENIDNFEKKSHRIGGLDIQDYTLEEKVLSKFDLEFTFNEFNDELNLNLVFNSNRYSFRFAENMAAHFGTILENVLTASQTPLAELHYLAPSEIKQLTVDFNPAKTVYPEDKTIVELFENQASATPDTIALVFEEVSLTYKELNEQSNALAHYLRKNYAVAPDDLIGIKLERSEKMIVVLLAILKSGAAYVPIDPSYPQERIAYIEKDSGCKIVIDEGVLEQFDTVQGEYFNSNPEKINQSADLAYIIYTSGTTGNPKGVMVAHNNVVNLITSQTKEFKVEANERILQASNLSFDASVEQIFLALLNGAALYVLPKRMLLDPIELERFLVENKITHFHCVPSVVSTVTPSEKFSLKRVVSGGDTCSEKLAASWGTICDFYNEYGPTETTVTSIEFLYRENAPFSIGRPIGNTQVYILSNALLVNPLGIWGKIYISGAGITRGYLNRDELTAEKFIDNPFISGIKMYDTGDLGRWLADGTIEFLGRDDHQVKIRGFRIELGEIESSLLQFSEAIKQGVVEPKEVNGEKILVAYYVAETEIDKSEIRAYLQGKLPEYMVPAFYIALESIPLTANGKTDRKALPGISGEDRIRKEYVAPRNQTEEIIAGIWQEVLGIEQVGITDNFFELGGHSLIVGQIISRINKQLNQTVSFKNFFATATIEALCKVLNQDDYVAIPQTVNKESYPLSDSQYRLWILSQLENGSVAYNMPAAVKLTGDLDKAKFNETFKQLIQRHEILRTSFRNNSEGQIQQYITPKDQIDFAVTEEDFSNRNNQQQAVIDYLQEQNSLEFDLEQAPLIRASLIKLSEKEHIFFFSLHHIIGDGWSMQLVVTEVVKIYNAINENQAVALPELNIQYKDYAVWTTQKKAEEKYEKSKAYWLNQFSGKLPALVLPSFRKRPLVQTYNGDDRSYAFPQELLEKLKTFSRAQDSTLFMTLMAGIKTLLYRYTNEDDIIVGTPIAGRDHPDLENQIGLYLNTLAIRTRFEEGDDFLTILNKEKETLLNAYQHQDYSFDELAGSLNLKRDLSRSALFDVLVVLQNQTQLKNLANNTALTGLEAEEFILESKTAKVDVSFTFVETEQLQLTITYNTDIYDALFIEAIFGHLENLFTEITAHPEIAIEELDYLTVAEKTKVLADFNDTWAAFPQDKTMIDLFEEQVIKTPDAVAVVFEEKVLTYNELNKQANQLGHYLRAHYNIATDDLIGIKLNRSEKMIVTLLGILKSGAAYVPIDLAYPEERIAYIEQDSNSKIVIDETVLELFYNNRDQQADSNPERTNTANDLAYIIYTSGTTGNPKGVMIEHRNAVALIYWSQAEFDSTKFDTVYAVTSYCFDLSVFELFYTLSTGKRIKLLKNGLELKNHIETDKNTLVNTVPSVVNQLLDDGVSFESVGILNMAGEPISHNVIRRLPLDQVEVYNLYGPSEDTTYSTYFKIKKKEYVSVPIGKAISNSQVYILDSKLQVVTTGVYGKIYVAGAGVARGYLNKPELTKEKFVDNPFESGTIMYDTGDLGRWLPDGTIEFLGRKDHQVKIRGFRIELGEIETCLLQFSDQMKQVVVEPKEVNGEKVLVAYYAVEGETDKAEIKTYLRSKLPEYMLPSFYVVLDSLPLTPNGKTDRKALPEISGEDGIRNEYVAPRDQTEQKMAEIWQEVLGLEKIGITDNFFDLGGNSLTVAQVINRFGKELNKTVSFKDFFVNTTIESLSKVLNQDQYLAIPEATVSENYPLTGSQYRLWILSQLENGSVAYNMPSAVKLTGDLDIAKFNATFTQVIRRHEILRTSFKNDTEGQVRQYIKAADEVDFAVNEIDFTDHSNQQEAVLNYVQEQNNLAFNLEQAPLIRASLIKLSPKEHVFFFSMHHIIGDGWSMELLVTEIVKTYNAIVEGNTVDLPKLNIHYKDYAVWSNQKKEEQEYQKSKEYWLNRFKDEIPVLELPGFRPRPLVQTYNGADVSYQFSDAFSERLKSFSKEHDLTLFMTLMAGIKILFYQYTGQDDFIVGTPIAGREHPDLENQIGLYLNTLAIRTKFGGSDTLLEILNKEKEALLNAYQHQKYPFDELAGSLNLKRNLSRSALFDVLVVLQNQAQLNSFANQTMLTGLKAEPFNFENHSAKFDLTFTFVETQQVGLTITYNTDLYDSFFVERFFTHLENIWIGIMDNPLQLAKDLEYVSAFEQTQLTLDFNPAMTAYPEDKTITELFEYQVSVTPDAVALVFEDVKLTYKELNKRSNALGHYLRKNYAVAPDDLIGIKLERSESMIVVLLAILKSGAAYVPIDPSYPQERIAYIEKDSGCKLVIDDRVLEQFDAVQDTYSNSNPEIINESADLAYIIYTSGTTGNPKGVMVEHSNVVNLISSQTKEFKIEANERILQASNLSFDASVEQIFLALLNGAALYVLPKKTLLDAIELERFIAENKITHFHCVPSVVSTVTPSDKFSLKRVVSGGDTCSEKLAASWGTICDFYNEYGPTETTVTSIEFLYRQNAPFSIGRPIGNTQVYILGNTLQVSPLGIWGKIYISGAGITRGYLNRDELTSEKFIDNPFTAGTKMYDTGDLGRWLPDGNIEFLGRDDHQVKIRGFRIELGEIESSLLQFSDAIQQGVVEPKEVNGEKVLVAYYVAEAEIDKSEIRAYLQGKLPEYMVPAFYVALESMPLTANGKTDRKALPGISGEDRIRKEYVAPRNQTEEIIAGIWQEVLGIDQIGITDNFFEMGGHSLIIGQIINRLNKQLHKNVTFKNFFSNATIATLAEVLSQEEYEAIPQAVLMDSYPLTGSQYRLWVLSQFDNGSLAYNMPSAIKLMGTLDKAKFNETINLLIQRHEILRTSFRNERENEVRQFITPADQIDFAVTEMDFSHYSDQNGAVLSYLEEQNNITFNLEQAPLIRASLLKLKDNEHVFFFSMHHIIGDGWSTELIVTEVVRIYNAIVENQPVDLPELKIQYKDYSVWHNDKMKKEGYLKAKEYWLNQFSGTLPAIELPVFKKRPLVQTFNGDHKSHQFSEEFGKDIKAFAKENEATLFMVLMAGVKTLLHKYSGQEDIIVGTPIAGREHPDLENQIGLYLNTLAIRTGFEQGDDFARVLNREKETLLNAYEHQEYPFDELVGNLNLKRDLSRSALFDVVVVLQNQTQLNNLTNTTALTGLQVELFDFESTTAKFDLTFTFFEAEQLQLTITYNTAIYDGWFIEALLKHLENIYKEVIKNPKRAIATVDYLSKAEKTKIVTDFNNTQLDYPGDKTIVSLFEEQVADRPDAIAVVFEDTRLTYEELNKKANQLGHYLREEYKIIADDLVGIRLDRSEKIIIAIMAILKSGAAYVPIDSNYPQERIDYIEKDSACKLVIDEAVLAGFEKIKQAYSCSNLERINQPDDLAYIMYTSGTTGNPKGVMVGHRNVIRLVKPSFALPLDPDSVLLSTGSISFDATTIEYFGTLLNGAKLIIVQQDVQLNLDRLAEAIQTHQVNSIFMTASWFNQVVESKISLFETIANMMVGGDVVSPVHVQKVYDHYPAIKIVNGYGPTENTTLSTSYAITTKSYSTIPIGKPIPNSQVYILDDALQATAIGVIGKMYVSGDGVARGYLNKPELTAEKFIDNPFGTGTKMYNTGDLGRWLPDGTIEFLGRNDNQVKIRGFRIELGEIETCLLQFSDVIREAVVEAREVKGEKVLVAYYSTDAEIEKTAIRSYLQDKLPEHMVPAFYVALEQMPLTSNGKTDRKALPEISGEDRIRKEYVAPTNPNQQAIAEIWQEVLGIEKVGITDNFFELGGNSLIVAQVINRLGKELHKTVSFKSFFSSPTIELLFAELDQKEYSAIPPAAVMENYPVTASQNRFWILSQLEGGSLAYNMPAAIKLKGDLNTVEFKETFKRVIQRHEILRTSFKNNAEGQIRQYITPSEEVDFEVAVVDFTNMEEQEKAVSQYLLQQKNIAFNFEQAPLMSASLLRLSENEHIFFLNIHHIIGDGWSMELLVAEIVKTYNAIVNGSPVDLPHLNIHYKDYAVWINEATQQVKYEKSKAYWLNQFSGKLPALVLPSFRKRPLVQTYNGDDRSYAFPRALSEKLKTFSKEQDSTLFMTLMAGIKTLLFRYTNEHDIIVGTPIAGRDHPDLENQIGLYLNTLAIRTRFEEGDDFLTILNREKETLLNAYQHQDFSFDELAGSLNLKRDLSRSALFDVLVVLQNQAQLKNVANNTTLTGLEAEDFNLESKTAKVDVSFTFVETEQLQLIITYNTDIYDALFIEAIFGHLENLFTEITAHPEREVEELDYLTTGEKTKVLVDFNDTWAAFPQDKTMIDLFEEQVIKTPDAIAVTFEDTVLTYNELNKQANQLGHYLRAQYKIETDDLIGIKLNRSEKMIVTLLGILKSGAAYVPIDLAYPQERIAYIEQDSNSKIVIDETVLELFYNNRDEYADSNPERTNTANDLAYIIYTSGTTGNPKGVMIEHRNAVALIYWSQAEFDTTKFDTVYAVTSYCFDLSVFELFYTLSTGKRIKLLKNGLELKNHIETDKNTLVNTVPSVVNQLLDDGVSFESVGILNMAGEPISHNVIRRLPLDQVEVYNLYGPSEDTTYSTYFKIKKKEYVSVPIGKAISNSQVYILDSKLQVVTTGVYGKIYVAGAGVARGYLNKPELTAEKFIDNPFKSGTIMYDTGDLGRWLPDGTIEFLGRKDHQVKIRGFRIELGEIETCLLQFSDQMKQVVVEPKEVNGEKVLVAYYAVEDETDKAEIKAYLRSKLPEYMLPSFYVVLDSLPLTPNGKTDRKALPEISGEDGIRNEYVAPRDQTEQKMAEIWQEVLGLQQVGITDNFFDLGGNSISAINTIGRMNREFLTTYPLDLLFHHGSIGELVKYHVDTALNNAYYEYGNPEADHIIFAFPAISGYGNVYRELFHANEDWKFFAFNFIENEAEVTAYYANKINELQPQGAIILFGWSAGGTLSYDVAAYLTNTLNRKVSRIIMFDALVLDPELLTDEVLIGLHDPEKESEALMQEALLRAKEKQKSYLKYLRTVPYNNKVPTEVDLVKLSDAAYDKWEELFEKVNYVIGQGEHYLMLEGENLAYNKDLLNQVLGNILQTGNVLETASQD